MTKPGRCSRCGKELDKAGECPLPKANGKPVTDGWDLDDPAGVSEEPLHPPHDHEGIPYPEEPND